MKSSSKKKPRIRKRRGQERWYCSFPAVTGSISGYGATPLEAYRAWKARVLDYQKGNAYLKLKF